MSNASNNAFRKHLLAHVDDARRRFITDDDNAVRRSQQAYDAATNSAEISKAVADCDFERNACRDRFKAALSAAFEFTPTEPMALRRG